MKRLFPFGLPLPFYAPEGDGTPPPAGDPPKEPSATPPVEKPPVEPPSTPPEAKQPPNALASGGADDTPPKQGAADWPADWREKAIKAAGADEKVIERLKRMDSPGALLKSFLAADARINSGKPAADEPIPDDPEKAKEWRKARDIPDDPTGYAIPDDVKAKLGDEDKPIIASYAEQMHKLGMPQKFVAEGVRWYTGLIEAQAEQQAADDKAAADATRDALRDEWGPEFKANSKIAERFAKEALPGVDWFTARLPDGRALGNVPEVVKMLTRFGLAEYGDAAFAGGEQARATTDRLAELDKIMKSDWARWEKSPDLRREHFELTEAKQRREARLGGS